MKYLHIHNNNFHINFYQNQFINECVMKNFLKFPERQMTFCDLQWSLRSYLFNPLVTSRLYMPEIFKCKFSAKNIKWELSALFVVFICQPKKHLSKDLAPQHIRIWSKLKSKLKMWKKSSHFQKLVANFLFMTN